MPTSPSTASHVLDLLILLFRNFYEFANTFIYALGLPLGEVFPTLFPSAPDWLNVVMIAVTVFLELLLPGVTAITLLTALLGVGLLVFLVASIARWAVGFIPL